MLFNLLINFLLTMVYPMHFDILISDYIWLHIFIDTWLFLSLIGSFWFINFLSGPTIFIMLCNRKLIEFDMLTTFLERVPTRRHLIYLATTWLFQDTSSWCMWLQIWFRWIRIISSRLHLFLLLNFINNLLLSIYY